MSLLSSFPKLNRLGFHYFPDTDHYRKSDLETWLAELQELGAAWLVLFAPMERAIPEDFLAAILEAGIQPLLHFKPRIESSLDRSTLHLLLSEYSRWGVRHAIFFDRPNIRSSWSPSTWSQVDLVDRFLDKFIPLAELLIEHGMVPIFPGLEPGGDYWDLAFLRSSLASLQRRGKQDLLNAIGLGAYSTVIDRPLDWGSGGPLRWPGARPYLDQPGVQDHRGFYIFEWYLATASDVIGKSLPVFMLEAGYRSTRSSLGPDRDESVTAMNTLSLIRRIAGNSNEPSEPVLQDEVLACCFCLVPLNSGFEQGGLSWYQSVGSQRPVVDAVRRWVAGWQIPLEPIHATDGSELSTGSTLPESAVEPITFIGKEHLPPEYTQPVISHYILLPLYAWGAADWDFELISPLLRDSHPTVGFSLDEASRAERVTVVGGPGVISNEAIDLLRSAGCSIERLLENGTIVAT